MTKKSEIPFGAQFSPNQIDLPGLLEIIHERAGSREEITRAIQDTFFANHSPTNRWKLADNTVLALRAYGLLDDEGAQPTELASDLLKLSDEPARLYEAFARHILLNCKGLVLVETVTAMKIAGEDVTLHTLQRRLRQRGLHVPRGAVHLSSMRLWLAQAGVFDSTASSGPRLYEVNQERIKELTGVGLDELDRLTQLNTPQRAFLRALIRIVEDDPHVANKVADLATGLYGVEYNHKELPKSVLFPLQGLGFVEVRKSTAGRGAKPYEVYRTQKFYREISDPILNAAAEMAGLVPRQLFEQPLAEILRDLKSSNKHVKGKALELLAIHVMRLLDLDFESWLARSVDTEATEVQLLATSSELVFNCWQIHCKDAAIVTLEDIATECVKQSETTLVRI